MHPARVLNQGHPQGLCRVPSRSPVDLSGRLKDRLQRLKEIGVFCVVKNLFIEDVAGLVFAGFGAEERYPSVVTYFVSAIVGGIVRCK